VSQPWTAAQIPTLSGKRAIVTGANIGLGYQTARELARAGAEVVLACRSVERGSAAAAKIVAEQPRANLHVALLDLSTLESVRVFADEVLAGGSLDILVNNAGVMALPLRQTTVDGFEMQLGTNYLGHFALTGLVLPALLAAPAPRVVSLSSNAHKRGKMYFDDLQMEHNYTPFGAYSQTKLAMLLFAIELQRQSTAHGSRLVSIAAHPGLSSTAIVRELKGGIAFITNLAFKFVGQDEAQGALPQLYAATAPEAKPGAYYGPGGWMEFKGPPSPAALAPQAQDVAAQKRLWTVSEELTGVTYSWPAA
jgi:NAD(P)-dependent dehydrogenase (short-subunit alcohol dehydrogenase family)